MKPVKVALVGTGTWGGIHAQAYDANPMADLVAVCDLNEGKAKAMADQWGIQSTYTSVQDLIEDADFDAVGVATPDHAHCNVVVALAKAGKKILVEKPLAKTIEDCNAMIEAVQNNDTATLMVDFHSRWVLPFVAIKDAIDKGELGEPAHAFIRLSDTLFVPRKMLSWASDTDTAWFLAVHTVDLLRWFFSDEVVKVYSVSQRKQLVSEGIDCPDYFQTILEFSGGQTALMENSFMMPEKSSPALFDYRCELLGSKGAIMTTLPFSDAVRKFTDAPAALPYYPSVDVFFGPGFEGHMRGGAHAAIHSFIDYASKGETPPVGPIDGLRATQVVLAMHESVDKGTPITLTY